MLDSEPFNETLETNLHISEFPYLNKAIVTFQIGATFSQTNVSTFVVDLQVSHSSINIQHLKHH